MNRIEFTRGVEQGWHRLMPDVDVAAVGPMQRLVWAGRLVEDLLERCAIQSGLRRRGDYETLVVARRAEPELLSPVDLAKQLRASPSGMTSKLDRLESDGLIERMADSSDRRLVRVSLSDRGRRITDEAFRTSLSFYDNALVGFSESDRRELDAYLSKLLGRLEDLANTREAWSTFK
jgi:DNA-binding MarR family transcriptional regulator